MDTFSHKLQEVSTKLEQIRKKAWNAFYFNSPLILVLFVAGYYYFLGNELRPEVFIPLLLLWIGATIILLARPFLKIKRIYKQELVKPMVEHLFPDFNYHPKQKIDEADFQHSQLFTHYNNYKGDDLFESKNTALQFSELNVSRTENNGKNTTVVPVFNGIFLCDTLPKNADTELWIYPNNLERFLGKLGKKLKRKETRQGQLIETPNETFNSTFTLRALDPDKVNLVLQESFYTTFLTMRDQLIAIDPKKRKRGNAGSIKDLYLAVVGNKVYIGISGITLFKVPFFKSIENNMKHFTQNIQVIKLALALKAKLIKD